MKSCSIAALVLAAWLGSAPRSLQDVTARALTVSTASGDHVVFEIALHDRASPEIASAAALTVNIDGREVQHVLLTPGSGRTTYDALLGPFERGTHQIACEPSTLWSWPAEVDIAKAEARVITAAEDVDAILARAPSLGIRADTIGTASDLPLLVYAEDLRRDGKGWVRYSVILSHEDGGTPAPALMARWGRTTDIELIYEVEWDETRVVQERFQGPNHEMRQFRGVREGGHPYLLIATLNNMFIDRGRSLVTIRPVPRRVTLDGRTRESVMDDHLWTYRVMVRELVAEKRIGSEIEDPREFLYVEANVGLENAAVSVQAKSDPERWRDSTRAREDLAVNRNGWVRIAVPAASRATALRWRCHPRPGESGGAARCQIAWARAFRLDPGYVPSQNLIEPGSLQLTTGVSEPVPLRQR